MREVNGRNGGERDSELHGMSPFKFKGFWRQQKEDFIYLFIFFSFRAFMKMMQGESCLSLFSKGQVRSDRCDKLPSNSQKEKTR